MKLAYSQQRRCHLWSLGVSAASTVSYRLCGIAYNLRFIINAKALRCFETSVTTSRHDTRS